MFFKRALETPNQLPVILGESLIFSTLTVHPINLTFAYLNLFICFVLLLSLCRSTLFFVCLLCSFVRVCVCLSPLAPYYHTNGHFRFSLAWGLLRMGRKLIVSSRALFHHRCSAFFFPTSTQVVLNQAHHACHAASRFPGGCGSSPARE